ncbi:MAG: hypothetical protein ACLSAP_00330 [Oscillospiraceae bacterium]
MAMGGLDARLQKLTMGLTGNLEIPPAALRQASSFRLGAGRGAAHPTQRAARTGLARTAPPDDTRWDIRRPRRTAQPAASSRPLPLRAGRSADTADCTAGADGLPVCRPDRVPSSSRSASLQSLRRRTAKLSLRPSFLFSKGDSRAKGTARTSLCSSAL